MIKKIAIITIILLGAFSASNAENVYVKYQGTVSLDNFDCTNTISSFVNRICHNDKYDYVVVLLNTTYYHYCRIPSSTVNSWLNASSKGKFYLSNIKGRFDCRLGAFQNNSQYKATVNYCNYHNLLVALNHKPYDNILRL